MKCVVLYDSAYGNTRRIAGAIASALSAPAQSIQDTIEADIAAADLLIVGSPTQGGRPTADLTSFLEEMPDELLQDKMAAAFDTRFAIDEHGVGLKLVMKTIGFAAPKIAAMLERKGCHIIGEPGGFIVSNTKGPLHPYELSRAADWATEIRAAAIPGKTRANILKRAM